MSKNVAAQKQYASSDNAFSGQSMTGKESETEIVAAIENRYNWFMTETQSIRRQWLVNAAMARGQQFSILHPNRDTLITLQEPPGRKQVMVDVIGPWKDHMTANLTRALPAFEAIPETMDGKDVSAARTGTALLDYYWENWRFIEDYITISSYIMDFGNAFVYLNYEEDGTHFRATPVYDADTGEPATDEDGSPITEKTAIGDITETVLLPHNIVCPLDDSPLEKKPWIIIVQKQQMDYFTAQYGDEGKKVSPNKALDMDNYNINRIGQTSTWKDQSGGNVDYANEFIYMQPPNDRNPDGMIVVVANGVLLANEKWPYEHLMTFPLEHFHTPKQSGEFFGRSWIERQIPLQRLLNLLASIFAENADDMAHLKLLIPNQSGIEATYDIPETLFYNFPYAPTHLQPGEMPSYIMNMLQWLEGKIRDVQNYHGASAGSSVSGVRSDVHAQNLQDQDLLPLTVLDEMMRLGFERMGEKILLIAAEKLSEERIISFTGEDNRIMMKSFKGQMLGNTRKVKVRTTQAFMRNKGATINNLLQMFQIGGIKDSFGQPDSTKLMRLLEFALPDSAFDDLKKQTDLQYQEVDKILAGEQTFVLPWQDSKAHLSVLDDYMNSTEFMDMMDEASQEDQQALQKVQSLIQHREQHVQQYMQAVSGLAPAQGTQTGGEPSQGAGQQKQGAKREGAQPAE